MTDAFLNSTMPESTKSKYTQAKSIWHGLCMTDRSGEYITKGVNFRITSSGSIRAAECPKKAYSRFKGSTPITLYGKEDLLIYVYAERDATKIAFTDTRPDGSIQILTLKDTNDGTPRSIAKFNVWTGNSDIINGTYAEKYIIYPDKKVAVKNSDGLYEISDIMLYNVIEVCKTVTKTINTVWKTWTDNGDGSYTLTKKDSVSVDSDVKERRSIYAVYDCNDESALPSERTEDGGTSITYIKKADGTLLQTKTVTTTAYSYEYEATDSVLPDADFITVFGTRVFGVSGSRIFASENGSYASYNLDTSEDFDENNAWYSATQDGGDFYAITSYGGHVTAFKSDKLYELYNTKNPFRIKEICNIGAISANSVACAANVLFFTSHNGVYRYTGSYPKEISEGFIDRSLFENGKFQLGISGSWDAKYYLHEMTEGGNGALDDFTRHPTFCYDESVGVWSVLEISERDEIFLFASNKSGIYAVSSEGEIYRLNTGEYGAAKWKFETPIYTGGTADVKELIKIQAVIRFHSAGSIRISAKYDNGEYRVLGELSKDDTGIYPLYCPVYKSEHIARSFLFECEGDVEIVDFEQIFKTGGKRNA